MWSVLLKYTDKISNTQVVPQNNIPLFNHLCLNVRSGRQLCEACVDACPVQGLSLDRDTVNISECVNCGLCAVACPTGVFDHLWEAAEKVVNFASKHQPHRSLWVTCSKAPLYRGALRINCLGELVPELVLYLLSHDVGKVNVLYDAQACENCDFRSGELLWKKSCEQLSAIYRNDGCFKVSDHLPEREQSNNQQVDITRRDFFRSLTSGAQQLLVEAVLGERPEKVYEPFSQSLSLRRKLFIHIISQLNTIQIKTLDPGYLRHPEIGAECTFCGSCVKLCPSGAMKIEKLDEDCLGLLNDATMCNMCGLCANTCPSKAIKVDWAVPDDQPLQRVLLAQGKRCQCPSCGEFFWNSKNSGAILCPGCESSRYKPKLTWD
ncbi:MAG: 4Fe-4S binding protein, partial [Thermacetogeniaceae bacterium]